MMGEANDPYREVGMDVTPLLDDAQVETMADNLIRLIEKGDALAAAVELVNETYPKHWPAMMDAARAWRAARRGEGT